MKSKNMHKHYIDTAIILAAGQSTRMGSLTKNTPKCLLKYNNVSLLTRIINQLADNNIKEVVIVIGYLKEKVKREVKDIEKVKITLVENDRYKEDTNIYSLYLALKNTYKPVILIEADTIMDDDCVQYITGDEFGDKSAWFTNGHFKRSQYGGILKSDVNRNIIDIKIIEKHKQEYKDYKKLIGAMRIGINELEKFKALLKNYCQKTIKQYFLIPWIENLKSLPAIESDIKDFKFATFNTPTEYNNNIRNNLLDEKYSNDQVELIEIDKLRHIEGFDSKKAKLLANKIFNERFWFKPIYVEKEHLLVLDGQHRLEAAKELKLKYIPVQLFDYNNVKIWSLRDNEIVNRKLVIKRALDNNIYPYKTVKHYFSNPITKIKFPLNSLK